MYKIHPHFLDDNRLRYVWREGLSAQKQISQGARWHEFETTPNPSKCLGAYLSFIASEGLGRGMKLNHELIEKPNFEQNFLSIGFDELEREREKLHLPKDLTIRSHPIYDLKTYSPFLTPQFPNA